MAEVKDLENVEQEATAPAMEETAADSAAPAETRVNLKARWQAIPRKKRRRIIRLCILALLLVIAAVVLLKVLGGKSSDEGEVVTDIVQYGSITSTVQGSGLTKAKNSETITITTVGTVVDVLVAEGETVTAGTPLFTIDLGPYAHGFSVRDLVLLVGGGYLIYKGIAELRDTLKLTELKAEHCEEHKALHRIALPQAVGTIMVMDLVFSIDSVITAVGMADHLIIMIIAVMLAVFLMMIFIDPISNFINGHPEMKMLALTFIVAIGCLLVIDSAGFHTGIELLHMPLEKLIVYFAMVFCIVLEVIQMRYNANVLAWRKERWQNETAAQIDSVRAEMMEQMKRDADGDAAAGASAEGAKAAAAERIRPVIIGNNVYVMMPMAGEDAASFKELMASSSTASAAFDAPLEIGAQVEDVEPTYEEPAEK